MHSARGAYSQYVEGRECRVQLDRRSEVGPLGDGIWDFEVEGEVGSRWKCGRRVQRSWGGSGGVILIVLF